MSGFRPCHRCPDRSGCAARFLQRGERPDCAAICGPAPSRVPGEQPMTLPEAAGVVVRHWDAFGARGIEAAITLLRRVLERCGRA